MYLKRLIVVTMLLATLGLSISSALAQQHQTPMSTQQPVAIESAEVLPEGQLAIDAGLAFEFDREVRSNAEYDNLRLSPLGARYGLGSEFEIGAALAFSSNDASDAGAPDESGLEGISLFGKLELNQFSALRVGLTMAGDDDVRPYPNDGVDVFANLALQKPLERGLLYGEFGYKAQGGDLDGNSYFNYGVGYALAVTKVVGVNFELVGEQAQGPADNALDLVLGANLLMVDSLRLAPYVSFGLNDASPDFAIGGLLEFRL